MKCKSFINLEILENSGDEDYIELCHRDEISKIKLLRNYDDYMTHFCQQNYRDR